jgi:site-specific recombinase XerD
MTDKEKLNNLLAPYPPFVHGYFASLESTKSIKTRLDYAYDLGLFFRKITKALETPGSITEADIYKYLNDYSGDQNRARKLATMRSFFAYLRRTKLIPENPTVDIETPKIHSRPIVRLNAEESTRVVNAAKFGKGLTDHQLHYSKATRLRDTAILTLFLTTGIRVSELAGLNLSDFDFTDNSFEVERKGGNRERLYFAEDTRAALLEYIEHNKLAGNSPLFPSRKSDRLSIRQIENVVSQWVKVVTPKPVTCHGLRRTYGTELYNATGDISLVATVLGHKDVNTT